MVVQFPFEFMFLSFGGSSSSRTKRSILFFSPLAPMDAHQLEEDEEEEEVMLDQANLEAVPQIAIKGGEEDLRVEESDGSAGPSGLAEPSRLDDEQAGLVGF